MSSIDYQKLIQEEFDEIKNLVLEKNKAYGNSAFEPQRVFSNASNIEQIKVRIDDKLSRIKNLSTNLDESVEDTVKDLIGYLVILRIAQKTSKA
jgi:hypothetical protein